MKHLLLIVGGLACMTFASSCSPESVDDMQQFGDGYEPSNPIIVVTPPPPPPPPPTPTDPHGDKDKDKTHG